MSLAWSPRHRSLDAFQKKASASCQRAVYASSAVHSTRITALHAKERELVLYIGASHCNRSVHRLHLLHPLHTTLHGGTLACCTLRSVRLHSSSAT